MSDIQARTLGFGAGGVRRAAGLPATKPQVPNRHNTLFKSFVLANALEQSTAVLASIIS